MKVYVSELPKDCIECPFCQDIKVNAGMDRLLFCKSNKGKAIKNIEKSFDKCIVKNEFQSLTDYTKQVRKKGREKIKNLNQQLKSQPAEIIEKINGEIYTRMVVECKETKYTDINLILNNILKEYQK